MIRVGFTGCGAISGRNISQMRDAGAEVTALADPEAKKLRARGREFGVESLYASQREMLDSEALDAVFISSPHPTHAELTIAALSAGLHVLCEKPMATTCADALRMVAAAEAAGRLLMIGTNHRFEPEIRKTEELVRQGYFGKIYQVEARCLRRRGIPGLGRWQTARSSSGGGIVLDLGVHAIDRVWFMLGKPRPLRVSAQCSGMFGRNVNDYVTPTPIHAGPREPSGAVDIEDNAVALIRFENGLAMTLTCAWAANVGENQLRTVIMGDEAGAEILGIRPGSLTLFSEQHGCLTSTLVEFDRSVYPKVPAHFIDCIVNGTECLSDGRDGVVIQSILDAVYQSSNEGREVDVLIPEGF